MKIFMFKKEEQSKFVLTVSEVPSCPTGFQSVLQSRLYMTLYLVVHCLQHPSRPCVVIPLTKLGLGNSTLTNKLIFKVLL